MDMKNINLKELEKQYAGIPYKKLIQHQIRKAKKYNKIEKILEYSIETFFSNEEKMVVQTLMDIYRQELMVDINNIFNRQKMWNIDCAEMLHRITSDAKSYLSKYDDDLLFNIFHVITLYFSCITLENKEIRKIMGIKKGLFFI